MRHASALVLGEHKEGALAASTAIAVSAASSMADDVAVLVVGQGSDAAGKEAAGLAGVSKVFTSSSDTFDNGLAEAITPLVSELHGSSSFSHIVAAHTASAKNVVPRLAAGLDVQPIADVIEVQSADTFVRPIYAGNALATVQSSDDVKLVTIRPTSFAPAEASGEEAVVEEVSSSGVNDLSSYVGSEVAASDRPELSSARVVVSGGRGMKDGENFGMLYNLADKMGAAVGASRAAVDAGYCANDMQVGQTGKVVAPELYVAVGISGAIQHLAGMKDSKTIVCINKDEEAPIFQVSDYGLVADLFDAVPQLESEIENAA